MLEVGFEPTITVFERTKKVHPLDRAAAVMDSAEILSTTKQLVLLFLQETEFLLSELICRLLYP
jgi:hypothetical protein